ncbi:hypothetical protein BaRGS_00019899, partial [Batillaria attramentaria]
SIPHCIPTRTEISSYTQSLVDTLQAVLTSPELPIDKQPLLVAGRRTNVNMVQPNEITTFQGIHDIARSRGEMDIGHAIDYIVVDRRFPWNCIPDLVIGRVVYDNWLVGHAILEGQVVVVEATETLLAVHQLGKEGRKEGSRRPNNDYNRDLVRRIHVTNQALSVTCAPWKTLNGPDGRINMKKVKMHKGCGQL